MEMEDPVSETIRADAEARTLTYTAAFRLEEGLWWAQAVEVPEAFGQGESLEAAKASLVEAIEAALDWRVAEGEEIPPSGEVTVGAVTVSRP
jgi:predicted RNase H-like HicB family nuclease